MRKKSDDYKKVLPPSAAIVLVVALVAVSGFVLLFLSLAPSAGNRAGLATAAGQLRFVTPINVPYDYTIQFAHGSELFTYDPSSVEPFSDIGNIYFGSDTNYNERGIKVYTNSRFYQKDGKTVHYRLVTDKDPLLCYAVVEDGSKEGAAGDERLRKATGRVTFDVKITDAQGNIAHEASERNCRPRDYLRENQYACHYQLLPAELAVEQLRGNRFSCEMTVRLRDAEGRIIAEETAVSEKPVVLADLNYHITTISDAESDFYGNVQKQYDFFTQLSYVRPQEELDELTSEEKLGKLVFHNGIVMNPDQFEKRREVDGSSWCVLKPDHLQKVLELLNAKKTPPYTIGVPDGDDLLIAVSPELILDLKDCATPLEARFDEDERARWQVGRSIGGHTLAGEFYIIVNSPGEHLVAVFDDKSGNILYKSRPFALAHEMGHAVWPSEPVACDEYTFTAWYGQQDTYEAKGLSCPNPWPQCCCPEKKEPHCPEVNTACLAQSPKFGEGQYCLGMPSDYSENNKVGPFSGFSIMGYGTWYPDYFPAPLGKVE